MVDILFYKRKNKNQFILNLHSKRNNSLSLLSEKGMTLWNIFDMFRCIYNYIHIFMYPSLPQAEEFVQMSFCLSKDILFPLNLLDISGNKHHQARAAHSFWKMSWASCYRSRWGGILSSVLLWGCVFLQNSLQLSSPTSILLWIFSTFPPSFCAGLIELGEPGNGNPYGGRERLNKTTCECIWEFAGAPGLNSDYHV